MSVLKKIKMNQDELAIQSINLGIAQAIEDTDIIEYDDENIVTGRAECLPNTFRVTLKSNKKLVITIHEET